MRWILTVAAIIATSGAASAAGQGNGYGLGMDSCAVFAQKYGANPDVAESLYFTWAPRVANATNDWTPSALAIAIRGARNKFSDLALCRGNRHVGRQ